MKNKPKFYFNIIDILLQVTLARHWERDLEQRRIECEKLTILVEKLKKEHEQKVQILEAEREKRENGDLNIKLTLP